MNEGGTIIDPFRDIIVLLRRLYLGRRRWRPDETATARGVAVALMKGEAGGDPREHQGQVAQDGQAREYTARTILVSHNPHTSPT